MKETKSKAIVR